MPRLDKVPIGDNLIALFKSRLLVLQSFVPMGVALYSLPKLN